MLAFKLYLDVRVGGRGEDGVRLLGSWSILVSIISKSIKPRICQPGCETRAAMWKVPSSASD